ncbi:hypothetical protein F5Y09DRAFT_300535 [Xylaria sp. FL1042]|nr:hypothetical protein F5Y09DRAFT_300535 [Xylaria sp. FL1042]
MARRKVIADSEDEDDGDDVLLVQSGGEFDRPEPEPLSPQHRPSSPTAAAPEHHNQSSDVMNPSFFANIYDTQQILAAQQSHLVEHIVQQSQRASASSGDVSLPAKKRRRGNPSSGTDVTSPMVLSRPPNQLKTFADDVSEFTTPCKSAGQEWEIPSSPEDTTASHRTEHSASKEKAPSENKKRNPRPASSPPTAVSAVLATEEATPKAPFENATVEDQVDEGLTTRAMSMVAATRPELPQHNYSLPDTTKFYIAQSNLTTMQKLEYQKVNVKSSGATTIPYSTPSGYSSIPPLPGEELLAQPASPRRDKVINISSSLEMADSALNLPDERVPDVNQEIEMPAPTTGRESPAMPQSQTPVSKGRKRSRRIVEEDELCQDDNWGPEDIDAHQEPYKSRATKRRSELASGFAGHGHNMDGFEDVLNESMIPTQTPPKFPASALPDTDPFESQSVPQSEPLPLPKKRGRKRKQSATEDPPTQVEVNEELNFNQNSAFSNKAAAVEVSPEKPKKKRGRPRKSELSKATEELLLEPPISDEQPHADSPQKAEKDDRLDISAPVSGGWEADGQQRAKGKSRRATEEDDGADSKESRLPLKEVDNNLGSPSKSSSTGESTTKVSAEPGDENSTPKKRLKESPILGASQSKLRYRVGLSRRSRIAPLLKSIKK